MVKHDSNSQLKLKLIHITLKPAMYFLSCITYKIPKNPAVFPLEPLLVTKMRQERAAISLLDARLVDHTHDMLHRLGRREGPLKVRRVAREPRHHGSGALLLLLSDYNPVSKDNPD